MTQNNNSANYRLAFTVLTSLFFMWGFITCMNDILIPFFKKMFELDRFQSMMVQFSFFTAYPIIPWMGIMLTGFAFGEFFELPAEKRTKVLLKSGLAALSLFFIIRYINIYGDPLHWSEQKNTFFTFLSFINTTKYPPSLLFILLFLGIMFFVLFISEKVSGRFSEILSVFGRVPLFYFVIHLYVIHSLMFAVLYLQGFGSKDFLFGAFNNGRPKTGGGLELPLIYLIWLSVVLLLYPVCKWYDKYKSGHGNIKLLRYL